MTQQFSQQSAKDSTLQPPAREATVGNVVSSIPALDNPNTHNKSSAGTLSYHKEMFARGVPCKCPKRFIIPVKPYKTDYTEYQCQICQNTHGRIYD